MHKYRLIAKKGEGTFSEVIKSQSIKTGKYCAIKCMKNHFDSIDQVNNLREIQALRRLSPHPNIIKLLEVLYDEPTGRLALVFELMDMNMYECIRGRRHYLPESRVKLYMYQLIKSMDHMHRNGIFHRDIKPENILLIDDVLKLADFGSCRGIYSKQPYTEYISTRWYRAPECLLTDGYYNYKMDMWGVGCVFFEVLSLFPLFPGTNELDQIQKIHNIIGTPPPDLLAKFQKHATHMDFNFPPKEGTGITKLIPHVSQECQELILKLLAYNPDDRLSARQALRHPYFRDLREAEKRGLNGSSPQPSLGHAGQDTDVESPAANAVGNGNGKDMPGVTSNNAGNGGGAQVNSSSQFNSDLKHKEAKAKEAAREARHKKEKEKANAARLLPDIKHRDHSNMFSDANDSTDNSSSAAQSTLPPIKSILPDLKIDTRTQKSYQNSKSSKPKKGNVSSMLRASDGTYPVAQHGASTLKPNLSTQSLSFPIKNNYSTIGKNSMAGNPSMHASDFMHKEYPKKLTEKEQFGLHQDMKKSYVSPYSQKYIKQQKFLPIDEP
eukprot:GILJ01000677.1.p1 GENE.GILJ01000677.1~~GILJ01000677.1.p1  ORF type:complete len:552 (+),score=78.06 GILJ01000677.1:158-1813(+)